MSRGGGGPQPALLLEMRIDCMLSAELSKLSNRLFRAAPQEQCFLTAAEGQYRGDLRPPGHDEAAITARRSAAADVLLEDHYSAIRLVLLDGYRSPQPYIAAANDGNICVFFAS